MNNDIQLWRMRWFILIVFSACLLASIGVTIVIVVITKSLPILAIPTIPTVLLVPVVKFLFPPKRPRAQHAKSTKKPGVPP